MSQDHKTRKPSSERAATDFQAAASRVLPSRFMDYKEYLFAVYRELKESFATYSYLEFSSDSGFGQCTAMHLIVHGNRPLTLKGAQKIARAIGLKGDERRYFLAMPDYVNATDASLKDAAFAQLMKLKARLVPSDLDRRYLEFYSHWYNAAIIEILRLPYASDDPEWIADRLTPRVQPQRVAKTLTVLTEHGFLKRDAAADRLVPTDTLVSTGVEIQSMAVMSFHQQMLELAKASLGGIQQLERDISGLTFSVSKITKVRLKEEIVLFRRRLIDLLEADASRHQRSGELDSEIMQLQIALFPAPSLPVLGQLATNRRTG